MTPEVFQEIRKEWLATIKATDSFRKPDPFIVPSRARPARACTASVTRAHIARSVEEVARRLGTPVDELLGRNTTRFLCAKRVMLYRFLHERFPFMSSVRLGKVLGKDHTTILNGLRRAQRIYDTDSSFREQYDRLARELR